GILAAAVLLLVKPPVYISRAKLLVKFVLENKATAAPNAEGAQQRSTDFYGNNLLNSEVEVFSFDLAMEAAKVVEPEILVKVAGGTNLQAAASTIMGGLD